MLAAEAFPQDGNNAAQRADQLRAQLQEVQAKEAELHAREQQLDEALKPENIERSLAGVGSTRPEELRELRRRQLNTEKASVLNQLGQLAERRTRLESAIQTAETEIYQQSAKGIPTPVTQLAVTNTSGSRLLVAVLVGLFAVAAILGATLLVRRQ
jgi:hypothetical protein